jgi:hypothetical protein
MKTLTLFRIFFFVLLFSSIDIIAQNSEVGGFIFSKLKFIDNFSYLVAVGEVKNNSGKDCSNAYFTVKFLNSKGEFIGYGLIHISDLLSGKKKMFETVVEHIDQKSIDKFEFILDYQD